MISKKDNNQITIAYKLSHRDLIEQIDRLEDRYKINLIPLDQVEVAENLPILRITKNQLIIEHNGHTLFFHPSMSLLRMINIMRGTEDRFVQATGIIEGDTFLDATMGLGSDTLIASWAVGDRGKVIALECSPLIHILVNDGLRRLEKIKPSRITNLEKKEAWDKLAKASSRIETVCSDHTHYLQGLPDSSIEIIYFDPMFRETVEQSSAIKPLKNWAFQDRINIDTIEQACRVATKRIVLKEKRNGGEFQRLGFKIIEGSKYNPICFGVIDLTEGGR